MQVTLHIVTVKPNSVKWWGELYSEKNGHITNSIKSLPGLLEYKRNYIDTNTFEQTLVFDTIEASLNYRDLWKSNPAFVERKQYNDENLIVSFTNETYN